MRFQNGYVPYGAYWSTPFCKWQGSLANFHAVSLAAHVARKALAQRDIAPAALDGLVLGMTVPQKHSLYGAPWLAAMIGAEGGTGTMVSQACATGARALATAASEVETSGERTVLAITADRCSNGPHIYYPNPQGPGGTGDKEDWVMDSFGYDPWATNSMIRTAENVAAEAGISREQQDETTLVRYRQYQDALADGAAFQKRYMIWPLELMDPKGRKVVASVEGDEGVYPTTAEGLKGLRPVEPDGTVTFGSQTHPADGNCGIIVTSRARAKELSRDPAIEIQVLAYAEARTRKGFMAMATVPAARAALERAGIGLGQVAALKTHNPFAVNDVYLARQLGLKLEDFNHYGSSLIYGHPQGPTGTRLIIETIEELAQKGGGYGLFVGCAAGDTAAAVVLRVRGARR
jgi:acetyl-CoA acetyltransferase family protein